MIRIIIVTAKGYCQIEPWDVIFLLGGILKTAFITHQKCYLHQMGEDHPEQPARLEVIEDFLNRKGVNLFLHSYEAPKATLDQVCLVHSRDYVAKLHELAPEKGLYFLDADTALNPHTLDAAYRAVGAVILGIDLVMEGEVDNAFCSVRPPGHHAEADRAMGFCFFNNIAVGAAHALKNYDLRRVAILDFDVHHGNGTEKIFYNNSQVLICSTFQDPLFPGPIYSCDNPHIINVPLKPGTESTDFRRAVSNRWLPALHEFKPNFIFISAGFDGYIHDELGNFNLRVSDYSWVTERIKRIADRYSEGRMVSVLEGGYYLPTLGECVAVHIEGLMGI